VIECLSQEEVYDKREVDVKMKEDGRLDKLNNKWFSI